MNSRRLLKLLGLVGIFLAAFGLRIFRLDAQSIWWDEGISLHLATSSLVEILQNRAANTHPPLYFIGLKGWATMAGVTPFAARYSSVLASLLQVTAVYAITRRWFKRSAIVWTATALMAISPLSVIYGQETRVYAVLPLIFLAALLLTQSITGTAVQSKRPWLALAIVEWIGFHLHYVTIFMAAYISAWAILAFYQQRRWPEIRRWIRLQIGVGLATLPWVALVAANWSAVQTEASSGSFLAEPIAFPFMLAQVWVFHLTGLPGALSRSLVVWLAALTGLGLFLLVGIRWRAWRQHLRLAAHWLVPLALALGVWSLRSFSHPRYIAIFAVAFIPFAAWLIAGSQPIWRVGWLGLPLVLLSFWGLGTYFFDPDVAKDDMRGVAHYLEQAAGPEDLIVVPDAGWALEFEYNGRAPIAMPSLTQPEVMWGKFSEWTAQPRQIFTVTSAMDSRDWQNAVPYALESAGSLVNITRFDGLIVREYVVRQPAVLPSLDDAFADFGALQLIDFHLEQDVPANSAITLALKWQLTSQPAPRAFLDLRLLDVDNWPLMHTSDLILDASGRPVDLWQEGQTVTTFHVMPIPPGTPPLTYDLVLGLSTVGVDGQHQRLDLLDASGSPQGQQFRLPKAVVLQPKVGNVSNPYQMSRVLPRLGETAVLSPGLSLVAAGLDRGEVGPGQSLFVSLEWRAGDVPLPDLRPRLSLHQSGTEIAVLDEAPALGRYPTNLWSAGERVLEHRRLRIPADVGAGTAVVTIALGDMQVEIGTVEIVAGEHLFESPLINNPLSIEFGQTARLVGYDLPVEAVSTDGIVPLTLYWQAMATGSQQSYTVFAHILDENGRLIGQHDAPPVNGARPTTGWVADEYVIDLHEMTFRELDYTGQAKIEVGLYDPATGTRLLTSDGRDHLILPVELRVGGSE
jgi:4-amino-4-deoxy-L-arabinose transferase-like glycosyltransferase